MTVIELINILGQFPEDAPVKLLAPPEADGDPCNVVYADLRKGIVYIDGYE